MLDTRRSLASGLYPARLRVTFRITRNGKPAWIRKYYSTGCECSKNDFAVAMGAGGKRTEEQRKMRVALLTIEEKANGICEKHGELNPVMFERHMRGGRGEGVLAMFDQYINELNGNDQVGTKAIYLTARNRIESYAGSPSFSEITPDWLRGLERWMRTRTKTVKTKQGTKTISAGLSPTSISIDVRCLKHIFNLAIDLKLVSADLYPFGRRAFVVQSVKGTRTALTEKQKNAVLTYRNPDYQLAVDFWIFSYYCNGMNFGDILRLRVKDIQEDTIQFVRAKSKRTSRVIKTITIPLRKEVRKIIASYGCRSLNPGAYVFSVLTPDLSAQQQKYKIQDFIDKVNIQLRRVASDLGFKFPFTTYTARHTFANISLQKGASKEFIQEALGHQSIMTTENYIAGFDLETKRKMASKL